jgi:hypothetical protein
VEGQKQMMKQMKGLMGGKHGKGRMPMMPGGFGKKGGFPF